VLYFRNKEWKLGAAVEDLVWKSVKLVKNLFHGNFVRAS
jgi:hypothetical protein